MAYGHHRHSASGHAQETDADPKAKSDADRLPGRRRVLVVEDEPLIAFDLISEIEAGDHEVIGHCRTADEAIAMAGRERPDVTVMDIGLLGEQSGLDAARKIREAYGIGCVFVSATLDRVDPKQWGDIEPLALIAKPYRDEALDQAIRQSRTTDARRA